MKKIIILILLCFSTIYSFSQACDDYYHMGLEKIKLENFYEAINDFSIAIECSQFENNSAKRIEILDDLEKRKEVAQYFLERGKAKFQMKEHGAALEDFYNVYMLLPNYTEGHFLQGTTYFELQIYDLAIFKFDNVLEIDSTYAEAYFRRGLAKFSWALEHSRLKGDESGGFADSLLVLINKHYIGAIADYTKYLEIQCCPAEAFYQRGRAKARLDDHSGAIDDQTKAIEIDPNYAWAYQERGLEKIHIEDYYGAIKDLDQALNLNPDARSYRIRGNVKLMLGDNRSAINDCTESIKLDPKFPMAYYTRGLAAIQLEQVESACQDFTKAGELGYTEAYESIKKYCNK